MCLNISWKLTCQVWSEGQLACKWPGVGKCPLAQSWLFVYWNSIVTTVKELLKSIHVWQSYARNKRLKFFWLTVYTLYLLLLLLNIYSESVDYERSKQHNTQTWETHISSSLWTPHNSANTIIRTLRRPCSDSHMSCALHIVLLY